MTRAQRRKNRCMRDSFDILLGYSGVEDYRSLVLPTTGYTLLQPVHFEHITIMQKKSYKKSTRLARIRSHGNNWLASHYITVIVDDTVSQWRN